MKKKILTLTSYVLVAALSTVLTLILMGDLGTSSKLDQLAGLIDAYYIGETDAAILEDAAAEAMISAANDRWSYYIPASEYAAYQEASENAYVGVGITITKPEDENGLLIMEVNPGSSAEEAGLQVNDLITAIEGQLTAPMTTAQARDLVRGREGTQVELTVRRQGGSMTVLVTRRKVEVTVASGELLDEQTGLITIENFDGRCADETIAAIEMLLDQGAQKLILDVRNNPGGYAEELVKVLDYLLPEGDLFRTVDYAGREEVDRSDARFLDMPMAVLVNGESYSAAEFFAAALQEYEAAVVVGQRTTGKGRFQTTFKLKDGSAAALSIGNYFTPRGMSLEGVGITPDVEISVDEETFAGIYYNQLAPGEDPQIQAAMAALK